MTKIWPVIPDESLEEIVRYDQESVLDPVVSEDELRKTSSSSRHRLGLFSSKAPAEDLTELLPGEESSSGVAAGRRLGGNYSEDDNE